MRRNPARPYNIGRSVSKKNIRSDNNSLEESGSTNFIKLGLLLPYLYLLALLSVDCHERAYFYCLGIDKKLIQIEPQNNAFLIFLVIALISTLVPSINGIIEYRREYWKDAKKGPSTILLGLFLLACGSFTIYTMLKYLTGPDAVYIFYLLTASIVIYSVERDLRLRKPDNKLGNILKWLRYLSVITGIVCLISYVSGSKTGIADKQNFIKEGGKHLVRNYEKYSIYCQIDSTFGVERTRIYVTESKNDTIIITR